jgi:hypothetical protein
MDAAKEVRAGREKTPTATRTSLLLTAVQLWNSHRAGAS